MRRVSLMGIDGSGKTTLMRALQARLGHRVSFLYSPDFHEIPGFAGGEESRALTEFSRLADAHADPALKLASLYLRMCLFGEAEAYLGAAGAREEMCIERHPLIDSLTYLPVYVGAMQRSGVTPEASAPLVARLKADHAEVMRHVVAAVVRRNARLGIAGDSVEAVAGYCVTFAALPPTEFVRRLSRDYQTTLPWRVLYLDIPPAEAFLRIQGRGKALEAHESLENLARLDRLARSKFADFEALGVPCVTLPVSTMSEAELLGVVTGHLDAARP